MSALFTLTFDASQILAMATNLKGLSNAVPRAIRQGLGEGGNLVRTDVRKALYDQTGVKAYRSITGRTRSYVESGALRYVIVGTNRPMPIEEVKIQSRGSTRFGDWRDQVRGRSGRFGELKASAAKPVIASPWNVVHAFKRSFNMVGRGLVAIRPGKDGKRGSTRHLYGPSIAKELVSGQVPVVFQQSVEAKVLPVIEKRIIKAIGG